MNERKIVNPHANFFHKVFSRLDFYLLPNEGVASIKMCIK